MHEYTHINIYIYVNISLISLSLSLSPFQSGVLSLNPKYDGEKSQPFLQIRTMEGTQNWKNFPGWKANGLWKARFPYRNSPKVILRVSKPVRAQS